MVTCPSSPGVGRDCAPVEAGALPAAPAEQQCTPTAPRGRPPTNSHHHHQQQIAVQDWAGLCLRGQQVRGQGQWHDSWQFCPRPFPPPPHPSLIVGDPRALSHVVVRATVAEVVERRPGHGGRGLHDEAREEGWEAEAGPAQPSSRVPLPPSFREREQGQGPHRAVTHRVVVVGEPSEAASTGSDCTSMSPSFEKEEARAYQ